MKLSNHKNILIVGLSLILSLVSYTGVIDHLPSEAIKSTLVVSDYKTENRFTINYQNVKKDAFVHFSKFSDYCLITFQNTYNLKASISFKTYTQLTIKLREEQFRVKLNSFATHKTLYNSIV